VLAGIDDPATIKRSICPAGHKALYSDAWGGLPPKTFLERLDPKLAALRDRLLRARMRPTSRPVVSPLPGPDGSASARHCDRHGRL